MIVEGSRRVNIDDDLILVQPQSWRSSRRPSRALRYSARLPGSRLVRVLQRKMQNATRFATGRPLDIVCLGRFGVDFYAQQIGARLEDVTSFAKYLGGSSANTAFE